MNYKNFGNKLTSNSFIVAMSFLLFTPLLFATAISFGYSQLFFSIIGIGLSVTAVLILSWRKNNGTKIMTIYLKFVTLFLLMFYAYHLFVDIGFDLLNYQNYNIDNKVLILVLLVILSLFVYFILLGESIKYQYLVFFALFVAGVISIVILVIIAKLNLAWLHEKLLTRGIIPPLTILLFNWGMLLLIIKVFIKEKVPIEKLYIIPEYINYAIPILGFIGTVLGISLSASGIVSIISSSQGLSSSNQELGNAIAPLGIAFDTTLVALSISLIYTLIIMLVKMYEKQ